jgi:DsbC/DsbD-like thiol-disulfide interchange protein
LDLATVRKHPNKRNPVRSGRRWDTKWRALILILSLVPFVGCSLAAATDASPGPVSAELLADQTGIQPGAGFRLGVHLRLQPGWHVYWKYPGSSGLATQIQFRLPPGFEAEPFLWPLPQRFDTPGVGESLGYEGEVLFMARIRSPEKLVPGEPLVFRASCRWLACREVCRLGRADLELTLPAKEVAPNRLELFREWSSRLPEPAGLAGLFDTSPRVKGALRSEEGSGEIQVTLDWTQPPREVEWFAAPPESLEVTDIRLETAGDVTVLHFRARVLAGQRWEGPSMDSLLVFTNRDGRRRGVELPLRLRP